LPSLAESFVAQAGRAVEEVFGANAGGD
jgi:hypothetical protein